ncbi:MAG: carbohydrate kinase, YjeF related protein [Actinomycetia bacterium]|nr:carbohydrate kinase, YjeF related protein [Actinomycetes bacterium]
MRDAYGVEKIRAAEAALMAAVPEGTLMQRAATGLAAACAGVLRTAQGGGRVYGAKVVVLAGTGDNGGDALYAGALLARRGAAVTAILAGPRAHSGGRDALRAAGGRIMAIIPWANAGTAAPQAPPAPPPSSAPPPPRAATRVDLPRVPSPQDAGWQGTVPTRMDIPRAQFEGTGGDAAHAAARHEVSDETRPDIGRVARFTPGHEVRHAIGHADLIIDGLLGIGGKGGLREPYATLAQYAANSAGVTVAVDLPSGIDAGTGAVDGPAVVADITVTFGALKPGLLVDPGARHAGVVQLVDIGLRPHLDRPDVAAPQGGDIAALVPRPGPESDKYRRGVIGLLAGSERFTGAAMLATGGAVHGGAGMVRLVTAQRAADAVRLEYPEVVVVPIETGTRTGGGPNGERPGGEDARGPGHTAAHEAVFPASAGRVQAWAAGPGMGVSDDAAERLAAVLRTGLPVLVDADGLTLLSRQPDLLPRPAPTLLTPHAGELGRLLGVDPVDVESRRLEHVTAAARKFGACVLLKGSTTVIAQPGDLEPVLVNTTGTSWLATAGTGDVLSGLAGALLAQGLLPPQAAITAAYLHGLAARLAAAGAGVPLAGHPAREAPIGASDVLRAIPRAFRSLL